MDTGALMHFLQPRSHVSLYVALWIERLRSLRGRMAEIALVT